MLLWLSGRALRKQRKSLWVKFPGNTHTDKKKMYSKKKIMYSPIVSRFG